MHVTVSPYMGYYPCRQLYSPQFGRFTVSATPDEKRSLSTLGQAIRELRQQRGLGVEELAAAAMVDRGCVAAVEAGRLDPDFDLLLKLSASMGLRPSAFVLRAEELARAS